MAGDILDLEPRTFIAGVVCFYVGHICYILETILFIMNKCDYDNKKGSLKAGKDADFVVISDDYQAIATYSEGRKIFDRDNYEPIYKKSFVDEKKIA